MPTIQPTSDYEIVTAEFIRGLRSDPLLSRVVNTWRLWTGDAHDDDAPTAAQCPIVRITALGWAFVQAGTSSETSSRSTTSTAISLPVIMRIDTWVAGTNRADALNLSGLIAAAVDANRARMADAGARQIVMSRPVMANSPRDYAGGMIRSEGEYAITIVPSSVT